MRKNGFAPPRPVPSDKATQKPSASGLPTLSPSPPIADNLTDLAAGDSVNPGVYAVNPGVSEASESPNPRVREAVSTTNSGVGVTNSGVGVSTSGASTNGSGVSTTSKEQSLDNPRVSVGSSANPGPGADVSKDGGAVRYEDRVPQRRRAAVPDEVYDELGQLLEPWRIVTSPLVSGAEKLPDPNQEPRRPILFVGNHTIFGLYDSPLLVHELFMRGFRCRGLAHPGHWLSGAGNLFER
jgi:hypothetical protein